MAELLDRIIILNIQLLISSRLRMKATLTKSQVINYLETNGGELTAAMIDNLPDDEWNTISSKLRMI